MWSTGENVSTLKEEGNKYFKEAKFEKALNCYSDALKEQPKKADKAILYKNQGACYLKLGRYSDTATACTNCLELRPADTKALFRRCQAFDHMNRYHDAYRDAKLLLDMNPENTDVIPILQRLEKILFSEVSDYNQEPALNGQTMGDQTNSQQAFDFITIIGNGHFQEGNYSVALECYQEALQIASLPEDKALGYKNQGFCYHKMQKFTEAVKAYTKCLEVIPTDEEALSLRSQVSYQMKNYQDAYKDAKTLLELNPGKTEVISIIKKLEKELSIEGGGQQQTEFRNKAEDINVFQSEFTIMKNRGNEYFKAGNFTAALKSYEESLKCNCSPSDRAVIYKNQGACYLKMQKFTEAATACTNCLELTPTDTKALFRRCQAFDQMNRYQEAYRDAKKIADLNPENTEIIPIINWLEKVLSVEGDGQQQTECRHTVEDITVFPIEFTIMKNHGNEYFRAGNFIAALKSYENALKCNCSPTDRAVIYKNQGACYLKMQKFTEAATACTNCLDLTPTDSKALFRRCQAFDQMNRYHEAYRDAKKIADLNPDNIEILPIVSRLEKVLSVEGNIKQETECSQTIKDTNNPPNTFITLKNRGNEYFGAGNFTAALKSYEDALKYNSSLAERAVIYKNQGACYVKMQKFTEAATACTNCLDINSNDIKALYRRCQAFEGMKRYHDAWRDCNTILLIQPENTDVLPIHHRLEHVIRTGVQLSATMDTEEYSPKITEVDNKPVKLQDGECSESLINGLQHIKLVNEQQTGSAEAQSENPIECSSGSTSDNVQRINKSGSATNDTTDEKSEEGTVLAYERNHINKPQGLEHMKSILVKAVQMSVCGRVGSSIKLLNDGINYGQKMLGVDCNDLDVRVILSDMHKCLGRIYFGLAYYAESFKQMEKALECCFYVKEDLYLEFTQDYLPTVTRRLLKNGCVVEMKEIFRRQYSTRNSQRFEVWTCGYQIAKAMAEALRKEGEPGYDTELLKKLYLDEVYKILETGIEFLYFIAAGYCEKALEYSNGKDFEVLKASALINNQIGNTKKAYEYCEEALQLRKDEELFYLRIELEAELSDCQSLAGSVISVKSDSEPDEEWLATTNIHTIEKQKKHAARVQEAHAKSKRKKSKQRQSRQRMRARSASRDNDRLQLSVLKTETSTQEQKPETEHKVQEIKAENHIQVPNGVRKPPPPVAKQKGKPKVMSKRIFNSLIELYEVRLACEQCWIQESDIPDCHLIDVPHVCRRSKLLLKQRQSTNPWELIRKNPLNFTGTNDLCENVTEGNECQNIKCNFPHSDSEKLVWNQCVDHHWNVEALVNDLKETNLQLLAILTDIPESVDLYLGCKKCVNDKQYDTSRKVNSHTPECNNKHVWNKPSAVVMIKVNDDINQPLALERKLPEDFPNIEKVTVYLSDLADLLFKKEFKASEIVTQFDIMKKQRKEKSKLVHPCVQKLRKPNSRFSRIRQSSSSSHASNEDDESEEPKFDTEFGDVLTNEDIDECKPNIVDDEVMSEYYINKPLEELEEQLMNKPDDYKRCIISISGTHKAKCYTLGGDTIEAIEIRGRMNCGKAFDGDEVVVEVMDVKVLDSDKKVQRGRVIGVLIQRTNREAYNFVCTVDKHFSSLMIPICGKAPKLHIEDKYIKAKDDKVKNRIVCVYEKNGGKIEYLRQVKINPKERHNQLFLVKYEKWGDRFMYPFGYVVKVLEPGKSLESGQRILDLMYQVPCNYDDRTNRYLKASFNDDILPDNAERRMDLTKAFVLSIDPPDCSDVDDALSVMHVTGPGGDPSGLYKVGIHIADVSNFIEKDNNIDTEAAKRRISFYPADKMNGVIGGQHMLPEVLSTDICSLVEGKERYTLSLFIIINDDGEVQGEPIFKQTRIVNKRKMTYTEAQLLIDATNVSDDEQQAWITVTTLHKLAQKIKQGRLHRATFHKEIEDITAEFDGATDAHELVAEFMILANSYAAKYLVDKYDKKAPVRKQIEPHPERMSEWSKKHRNVIGGSFYFDRYCKIDDEEDPDSEGEDTESKPIPNFCILKTTFQQLQIALNKDDLKGVISAITTENIHPSYGVANNKWLDMQVPAEVTLYSGKNKCHHFSLQKDVYTWFTSPIRRYIDIVVHRMIVATLPDATRYQCPYKREELLELCDRFNSTVKRQRKHDRAGQILKTAHFLKISPAYFPGVVTSFDAEDGITFNWSMLPHLKNEQRNLRLSSFSVCDKPEVTESFMKIYWEKRIYDAIGSNVSYARPKALANSKRSVPVHHRRHITQIDGELWNQLVRAIDEDDNPNDIMQIVHELVNDAELKNQANGFRDDVTSEMKYPLKIVHHHVKHNMAIEEGSVNQLQLGTIYKNGLIQPQINLFSVTPTIDICIEHMRDPIYCFSEVATLSHKQAYTSVHDYKQTWLPMLGMEAACNAVQEGDPIIINNIGIELKKTKQSFSGVFEVPIAYCTHRQINFFANNKDKNESELQEKDQCEDFFCLRIPLESSAQVFPADRSDIRQHVNWRNMWTAHCIVNPMKSTLTKDKNVRVHFDVHEYSAEPPIRVLEPVEQEKKVPATVELLAKTLPHRRMEMAVNRLQEATEFCQKIVLGKPFTEEEQQLSHDIPQSLDIIVNEATYPLPKNNDTQIRAIKTAMMQRFTLIQGPPGTGKTLTGVKLVYWFNYLNNQFGNRRQVMYCGPSNSAVDVATRQMKNRLSEKCPKIIRVYSELLENQVFPLPRDAMLVNSRNRRYEMGGKPDLDEISLHHLVRKDSNPFARKIRFYDNKFKNTKADEISDEEVLAYQKLVTDASVHELKRHEVILCTASVSASPRILRATNVYQCVIDECGMCMEAETLVPLVTHKPEQVVLIGDHKQLRPIVVNSDAKALGLEISMFERQAMLIKEREEKSVQSNARRRQNVVLETRERYGMEVDNTQIQEKSAGLIMLDVQYRMHREICAFPSKHFYNSKLRTKETSYWTGNLDRIWPNQRAPIAFCHVEGAEESLSVSTDEGSEQSKSNKAEIFHAVRIYKEFVNVLGIWPNQITVLSQYKAQCKQIEKELKEQGIENPNVSTVVASQGDEWDFVILSTVRSLPRYEIDKKPTVGWLKRNLGFIIDHHQINVALTRARKGLVIIGNKHLLKCDGGVDGLWSDLLDYYENKGAIIEAQKFPRRPEDMMNRKKIFEDRNWGEKLAPRLRRALQRQYETQDS